MTYRDQRCDSAEAAIKEKDQVAIVSGTRRWGGDKYWVPCDESGVNREQYLGTHRMIAKYEYIGNSQKFWRKKARRNHHSRVC